MRKATMRNHAVLAAMALVLAGGAKAADDPNANCTYFAIQVVDRQTGRGVPLVELKTTNSIRYYTDSHGIVAFLEPGLMDREVFFHVNSHGYALAPNGFGYRGARVRTTPGTTATIRIDRINIAERLYRITGQGIYRDSVLTGRAAPLKNPVLNGQVMGQDSVFTCRYRGRIFWMWGDTSKPSYPLGNFAMSGAVSDLPDRGGLNPAVGVDLDYFVDETGFGRRMAPLEESGMVWLDRLLTVRDRQGNERMLAKFARLQSLSEVLERGLMVFNDETETFEPLVRPGLEFLPYRNTAHAFRVDVDGKPYYYFTAPSPMNPRLRVRATWDHVIDANRYEVLTTLLPDAGEGRPRWVTFAEALAGMDTGKTAVIDALEAEAKDLRVYDAESGKAVVPHNGTVHYNAHRQRWIGVFSQQFGDPSYLGEIWYAEADTPVGPWAYARKIVTHEKYSFYNPKHHPLFDQDGGRTIYFEGTYTWTFSGSEEAATPRYDYNQIMYRLDLDDPRLTLPAPVYRVRDTAGQNRHLLRDAVTQTRQWDRVQSVAFHAVEPGRASDDDLIAIYAESERKGHLTTQQPSPSSAPLFFALPVAETSGERPHIVDLYPYRHADSARVRYSTNPQWNAPGWKRMDRPLCRVWKTPPVAPLLDLQTHGAATGRTARPSYNTQPSR